MTRIKALLFAGAAMAFGVVTAASAQDLQLPKKSKLPGLTKPVEIDPSRLRPNYPGGATSWIAPMLTSAPGTISGERYSIDGKRLEREFGFSIVNANGSQASTAAIRCFDAAGNHQPRFNQTLTIPSLGAANWRSLSVAPVATNDGVTEDKDEVWCSIFSDIPVFAYGWSERRFGQDHDRSNISLIAAQPAGN